MFCWENRIIFFLWFWHNSLKCWDHEIIYLVTPTSHISITFFSTVLMNNHILLTVIMWICLFLTLTAYCTVRLHCFIRFSDDAFISAVFLEDCFAESCVVYHACRVLLWFCSVFWPEIDVLWAEGTCGFLLELTNTFLWNGSEILNCIKLFKAHFDQ